jgi:multidrug resistance efflux pump
METEQSLRKRTNTYYNSEFRFQLASAQLKVNRLLELQEDGVISRSELNRNFKAAEWLNNTLAKNIEGYEKDLEITLAIMETEEK